MIRPSLGLRAQLVLAFLLVSVLGAVTVAAVTFRQGRTAIVARAQADALRELRTHLTARVPDLPTEPTEADLRTLARQLGTRTALSHRGGPLISAGAQAPPLPALLRARAASATTALAQRFHHDGTPWLALALPVTAAGRPHDAPPLVVYASFSLASQQQDVDGLAAAARAGALPVALASIIPALLAARRLLRPVRRLRTAAEQMAGGGLDTRVNVTGNDELADLGRTFNTMAATLQSDAAALRAMEARARRFAADVSHELRTPLAAMSAVTEVLDADAASGRLAPLTAEALQLVSDETRKLTRLVDDLIEVSRFDAGAAVLHLDEVDLGELVAKTLALRHWHDRVRTDLPAGLRVRLDPRRVDVILANLVGNALRHGGTAVLVQVAAEPGRISVAVSDDGPGIPAGLLPHVFDRFTKGDAARARSEGSGLGLAIAAENARLHGGTLTAANAPDGGAVLTLTLPRS
ncbi:two-component system, OmpR family, sensor histidine kinase MtrB [Nonomuraea solani]|uniref:histidine kinase n=1 Tax=Nonomuraea solani TaxID=1144553 RepID=A0A1H5XYN2_9ACTN|nr:HAMP domain-containing sensor histidine kinase [Nonomuraea solani]SEG16460.1 two-component system, OmpR family, sensor histidine kinase MtrB [Nonomuraea solani]